MSYLSRVRLKPEIRQSSQLAMLIAGNSYGMHRLLWDLFPGRDGQQRNFLFREEQDNEQQGGAVQPIYYLLSPDLPLQTSPLFQVETKPFDPQLEEGDHLAFKLRANPIVSRKTDGQKRSLSHDVVMDAQHQLLNQLCVSAGLTTGGSKGDKLALLRRLPDAQMRDLITPVLPEQSRGTLDDAVQFAISKAQVAWLTGERAERAGYLIEQPANLQVTGYTWKPLPEKGRKAGFSTLDYEGVLTVTDPERFIVMLNSGLGKARAFGCGLMLTRRI